MGSAEDKKSDEAFFRNYNITGSMMLTVDTIPKCFKRNSLSLYTNG